MSERFQHPTCYYIRPCVADELGVVEVEERLAEDAGAGISSLKTCESGSRFCLATMCDLENPGKSHHVRASVDGDDEIGILRFRVVLMYFRLTGVQTKCLGVLANLSNEFIMLISPRPTTSL